ncbi:MAG: lysostaphin resistance A-like protein [Anaerolineae bacterium]
MSHLLVRQGRLLPVWRVILYLIAFQIAGLLVQIPLVAALALYSVVSGVPDHFLAGAAGLPTAILLASSVATLASALVVTWFFRTRVDGESLSSLGLTREERSVRQLTAGVAAGVLAMAGIFAVSWGAGWIGSVQPAWTAGPADALLWDLLLFTIAFVSVSLTEEIAFRGYVLQNLREQAGWPVAILGSSLLFAGFHGLNPGFGAGALAGIAAAGLFLALGYRISGALWFPIGLHFAWNTAEGPIFGFPVSGLVTPSLLILEPGVGDPLVTGGAFGPEAGLLGIGAALLGGLALWIWHLRGRRAENRAQATGGGLDNA